MNLDKWIGDKNTFSIEHRMLNIVLVLGMIVSGLSSFIYCLFDLSPLHLVFNGSSAIVLLILYYLSIVKKQYWLAQGFLIIFCGFIMIPATWIYNDGILGWTPYLMILFFAMVAVLLRGFWRRVVLIAFSLVTLSLMAKDYFQSTNIQQYTHIYLGLVISIAIIVAFFELILKYYITEKEKANYYLMKIERQDLELKMARLDRLDLIGEMAASIGHEVRNPLTTVRGFLQYYQSKKEHAQHMGQFAVMIQELDRANTIIEEFLSLAKNRAINMKTVHLNEIIQDLYPLINASSISENKGIFLQLQDVPSIVADENQIKQLVLNLARNAREAVDTNGKVIIATYLEGDNVVLSVKDNGRGIPYEVYEKLGTPFVTTKEQGTGLGLSICYRIVKTHKARMEVDTSSNGTTFSVWFNCVGTS